MSNANIKNTSEHARAKVAHAEEDLKGKGIKAPSSEGAQAPCSKEAPSREISQTPHSKQSSERMTDFKQRFVKFSRDSLNSRMIGFALCRAWVYVTFFNSTMLISTQDKQGTQAAFYQLSLICLVCSLVIAALANTLLDKTFSTKIGRVIPATLSVIGVGCVIFANTETALGLFLLVLSGVLTGFGSGLLLVWWGGIYSSQGGPISAAEASIAFIIGTLLIPLFCLMSLGLQLIVVSALPIASSILLVQEFKKLGENNDDEHEKYTMRVDALPCVSHASIASATSSDPVASTAASASTAPIGTAARTLPAELSPAHQETRVLLKVSAGSLVFGATIDVIRSIYVLHSPLSHSFASNFILPISALAAAIIILLILLFSRRLDFAFTYRPVLIFMSLSCLALPLLGDNYYLTYVLAMTGYFCFEIMNWVMLSDITYRFEANAYKIYGFGRAAVAAGVLIGQFVGNYLASFSAVPQEFMYALSLGLIFMMLITYTLTLTERDVAKITRMEQRPYKMPACVFNNEKGNGEFSSGEGVIKKANIADADKSVIANASTENALATNSGTTNAATNSATTKTATANTITNTTSASASANNAANNSITANAAAAPSIATIANPTPTLSLTERVKILAQQYEIEGRAFDVLLLFARGRSAARVEQELYISRGTVNTYSHRIYQKLGIHSRQELFDMLDAIQDPR